MLIVRGGNWWLYKIPPVAMLLIALLSGTTPASELLYQLGIVVAVVSLVCNFGYILNELSDVIEDLAVRRKNVSAALGARRLTVIAVLCAGIALALSAVAIGAGAVAITAAALLLPLAYSVPPLRLKERKWLGIIADATAAHVYPALLCLMIAGQFAPRKNTAATAVVAWSLAFGLRGILTHQVRDDDRDAAAGLATVVHDYGRERIMRVITYVIAPAEVLLLMLWTALIGNLGVPFCALLFVYVGCELCKLWLGWKIVLFTNSERPYLPFLNNAYYESWGPLAVALNAAWQDRALLLLPPILAVLFWERLLTEGRMTVALIGDVAHKMRA
jgi:4-hydroxybenzoate polyprenyltransferase